LCSSVFFSISARRKVRKISQKKTQREGVDTVWKKQESKKENNPPFLQVFFEIPDFEMPVILFSRGLPFCRRGPARAPTRPLSSNPPDTSAFERSYARTANPAVLPFGACHYCRQARSTGTAPASKETLVFRKKIPVRAPSLTPLRFLPRSGINS
jgi:hypothetical protein